MTSRATQNGQQWPQRPAIRARYDTAAREAGYGTLEDVLADTGLPGPEAGRILGVSAQTVGIMRRQRGVLPRKQPAAPSPPAPAPAARLDPAVARLRLRRLLREAREMAGFTQAEAAAALEYSASKVVRLESGQSRGSIVDVRALLDLYRAPDRVEGAEALVRAAKVRTWTGNYRGVFSEGDLACRDLEPSARVIEFVSLNVVPELLQTEEYAQAAVQALRRPSASPELASSYVQAVMRRQSLLDDPPQLRFWLDEAVLHRGMNAAMRSRQLDHLVMLNAYPMITIRVVPLAAGLYSKDSFTLLELDDPPETLLWMEDPGGGLVRQEDSADIEHCRHVLDRCDLLALPADALDEAVDDARRGVYTAAALAGVGGRDAP